MKTLRAMLSAGNPRFSSVEALFADACTALGSTVAQNRNYDRLNAKALPFKMEGMTDHHEQIVSDSLSTIVADLKTVPQFEHLICRRLGKENYSQIPRDQLDDIFAKAAYSMLAAQGNLVLESYVNSSTSFLSTDNAVMSLDSGKQSPQYQMEAFDPATMEKYMAITAVINALTSVQNQFMDVWFPTELIAAGETGRQLVVGITKIVTWVPRSTTGETTAITKVSINEAILNPDILDTFCTDVIPYASSPTAPASLVPASEIPTQVRKLGNVNVDTRPIKIGVEVKDIIGMLGSAPGYITNGVFDPTDQLDTTMNIGEVYFKITATNGGSSKTSVVKADVSNQQGARLTQYNQSTPQEYVANMNTATFVFNTKTVANNGDTAASVCAKIRSILGYAADAKFEIRITSRLSASANVEFGRFVVNAANTTIAELYGDSGQVVDPSALNPSAGNSVAVEIIGYMPKLRRTNSNIRDYGTMIDPNYQVQYLYPVRLQAPISSITPITGGQLGLPIENLLQIAEVRNSGHCLKVLEEAAAILKNYETNGIPAYSPMPGALFIKPFYYEEEIDVRELTFGMNAVDGISNLEASLANAIKITTSKMVLDTNMVAAMKAYGLPDDGYEFILLTDPRLSGYIMTQGDSRTAGDGKSFTKATTALERVKNIIYISMRRKSRPEALHPLDFGVFLKAPEIVVEVQLPRNGAMRKEVQVLPRGDAYVNLPALIKLNVVGMDEIYVNPPVAP